MVDTNNLKMGGEPMVDSPPLVSSYNDKIRPILDAIDNLRQLNVTGEGISLPIPTIVVIGDQSSGKSSVLDSLSGINLPRGHGITTRVPLIMRLQHHPNSVPEFLLQFHGNKIPISNENRISEAIDQAMVEIAGEGKGVSNVPLTLTVKKKGVPNLTMVDLPGITRVPVGNQPRDIYKQISKIIMEYIDPEENIILNVLSAPKFFLTCESVCMSRLVEETGQRTLAVVTRCNQCDKKLVIKEITGNQIKIRLGYILVRNRIKNETYDEARVQEDTLFKTHPLLSKIDKSMVGIPSLARRLVEIQSVIILKCLPDFVKKINKKLDSSVLELNKLQATPMIVLDGMADFMEMVGSLKETLQKILIRGEFDEYMDDKQMHCNARLVEMLDGFSKELHSRVNFSDNFLVEEIEILEEANGIHLPHFLPHSAFLFLLEKRVNDISKLPVNFINKVWGYIETICIRVFVDHCKNHPQMLPSMKKAAHNAMAKMKAKFTERVGEMIEMEKFTYYTSNPNCNDSLKKLMGSHSSFVNEIRRVQSYSYVTPSDFNVEGYGKIDIKHLVSVSENVREQAFGLKMRMTAYWEIVLKRMVDWMALQLRFVIRQMVNVEMQTEIMNVVMVNDGGVEKTMAEPSSMAAKRERLCKSIRLLQESKEVIDRYTVEESLKSRWYGFRETRSGLIEKFCYEIARVRGVIERRWNYSTING